MSETQGFHPRRGAPSVRVFAAAEKKSSCMIRFMTAASRNIIATQAIPEKICCGIQT